MRTSLETCHPFCYVKMMNLARRIYTCLRLALWGVEPRVSEGSPTVPDIVDNAAAQVPTDDQIDFGDVALLDEYAGVVAIRPADKFTNRSALHCAHARLARANKGLVAKVQQEHSQKKALQDDPDCVEDYCRQQGPWYPHRQHPPSPLAVGKTSFPVT